MLKIEFRAMGSQIAAFIDNENHPSVQALERIPGWFEEWEQALSRFRPDSELNRLNAMGGSAVKTSPTLWSVLQAALQAAQWSHGLVDPTILNSLERSGYDRSFGTLRTSPAGREAIVTAEPRVLKAPMLAGDWTAIHMDARDLTVTLPTGIRLDLGGIAKGWAAQQALKRLKPFGPTLVDASGDIAISGPRTDGSPWSVAVTDPLNVQENLETLALKTGAVATSGIDYHRWLQNGVWKHHIIDPRTGEPAQTDLVSVTITATDLLQAETAAKVVLILGSKAGLEWLENHYELDGLLALQDGRVLYSSGMQAYLWR
jgi:FAD:protein FMN transferase